MCATIVAILLVEAVEDNVLQEDAGFDRMYHIVPGALADCGGDLILLWEGGMQGVARSGRWRARTG